jgi:hypothetical protein
MGLGQRTGDPSSATPIQQILQDDTPRIELTPKPSALAGTVDKVLGLRHRLPFFGRKRG